MNIFTLKYFSRLIIGFGIIYLIVSVFNLIIQIGYNDYSLIALFNGSIDNTFENQLTYTIVLLFLGLLLFFLDKRLSTTRNTKQDWEFKNSQSFLLFLNYKSDYFLHQTSNDSLYASRYANLLSRLLWTNTISRQSVWGSNLSRNAI